jgi:hypothetical protein
MEMREPVLEYRLSRPRRFHCSLCGFGPGEGTFVVVGDIADLLECFKLHVEQFHSRGEDFSPKTKPRREEVEQAAAPAVRGATDRLQSSSSSRTPEELVGLKLHNYAPVAPACAW